MSGPLQPVPEGSYVSRPTPIDDELHVALTWEPHPAELAVLDASWPPWCVIRSDDDAARSSEAVDVLVSPPSEITAGMLDHFSALRLVHVTSHGVDHLQVPPLLDAITRRGIDVAAASSAGEPIAEYVIMAMIALLRRLPLMQSAFLAGPAAVQEMKQGRLDGRMGGELAGANLVVVGYGGLGRPIARRAAALGMRVTAVRRSAVDAHPEEHVDAVVGFDALDAVLPQADVVVLCVPLTNETRGLFDAARLARLPAGCVMINVARGSVIDEHALFALLRCGHLGGVAADVWSRDEGNADGIVPASDWSSLNLIATPHASALTRESRLRALQFIGENVARLRAGIPVQNLVDLTAGLTTSDDPSSADTSISVRLPR